MTERPHFHFSPSCIGEGNVNLLQCSCLENPRDGGAWWAAIYGVTQGRTRLKRLSSSSSSSHPYRTSGKTKALTRQTFVGIIRTFVGQLLDAGFLPTYFPTAKAMIGLCCSIASYYIKLYENISSYWTFFAHLGKNLSPKLLLDSIW